MLAVGLVVALALAASAPVLAELGRVWWTHPYGGHGMLVPLYSGALIWFERQRLRHTPRRREPVAFLGVVIAASGLILGGIRDSLALGALSLVSLVAATVWLTLGLRWLRAIAFPIALLALMLPLPSSVVEHVSLPIQKVTAAAAASALSALAVPVYQEGVRIELPSAALEIAEGCNGLRFLMALLTVAAGLAHVSQRALSRKLTVVASAIPLALLANAVRVVVIGLAVYCIGTEWGSGPRHHLIGKVVWALALLVLLAFAMVLRKIGQISGHAPAIERRLQAPQVTLGTETGIVR